MINRRQALKTMGGLAGMAAMPKFLSACSSDEDPVGITTYVYLMLENRTFDHVFGARKLQGLEGGDGLVAGMSNPDMNGVDVPIFEPTMDQMCVADPPHGWDASHLQFENGTNKGFVKEYQADHPGLRESPMQYLTRTQAPISWALADQYTICDRWFASV